MQSIRHTRQDLSKEQAVKLLFYVLNFRFFSSIQRDINFELATV